MANEELSKIYDKPRFGLIVGIFVASIVALLLLGWLFVHFDPLHVRINGGSPRTGMMLVHQGRL